MANAGNDRKKQCNKLLKPVAKDNKRRQAMEISENWIDHPEWQRVSGQITPASHNLLIMKIKYFIKRHHKIAFHASKQDFKGKYQVQAAYKLNGNR